MKKFNFMWKYIKVDKNDYKNSLDSTKCESFYKEYCANQTKFYMDQKKKNRW